jgi:hypothetical protein
MVKLTMSAVIVYNTVKTAGPNGKVRTTTFVTIKMGDTPYASRTLSGRYSQQDAITEFKRFPTRFIPAQNVTLDILKALAA